MNRSYKTFEWSIAGRDFQKIFGIKFGDFFDSFNTMLSRKICIDVYKFDDWLHSQYGKYEVRKKSMEDVVRENYGEDGVEMLMRLL
jgi:hypothetical protein